MVSSRARMAPYPWKWRSHSIYAVRAGERRADRPALLCVHGFGASTDHWRKNIEQLQDEYEVWAIDLLGFGRSDKAVADYGGDLWRDQLDDFIREEIGRPVVLLGNSLGGYASLCVAGQCPDSVLGVVLLNSAGPFSESEEAASAEATDRSTADKRPNSVGQVIGNGIRKLLLQPWASWLLFQYVRRKPTIRKTLEKVYVDRSAVTDRLVEEIYRPSCDRGAAQVFASVFKSRQGAKVDELLTQMSCPLLLLWGEGDPWMDTRSRSAQFRQYYSDLTEHFLNAGHCPHDEVPEQVNHLGRLWVEEQVADRARAL